MPDFRLPDLGEGLDEAEIVEWRVQVGDQVGVDQIVVEVETAKAAVEVPIPFAGVVSALHAQPGTKLAVGQPLISVGDPAAENGFREPGVVTAAESAGDSAAEEASGNVLIGYGTSESPRRARRHRSSRSAQPRVAEPVDETVADGKHAVAVISPLVRKLARDAGLDVHAIAGTGPQGLILRRDVESALAGRTEPAATEPAGTRPAGFPPAADGLTRIPLTGLRATTADKLSRSRREIPEATVWVDVDATELLAARAALNARDPQRPVSLLALVARFTVLALGRFPELNGRVERDEIVLSKRVNLGFAAQIERGLVVPVVPGAEAMTTRELSAALADRTAAAREGKLAPAHMTGGTITVNNYGVFGVDGSAAIINHPEVAIVGIGRIIDRPWVIDGQLTVRKVTQLTLAFDHRVCDGGTAGGFLRYLADCVESPVTALGDV